MSNLLFLTILLQLIFGQSVEQPDQPLNGPGGAHYVCDSVKITDHSSDPDGYWLYEPVDSKVDSAEVIVFIHGYGAINPMIYGGWIRHLVQKGNIVIFPRYQKNLFAPSPDVFPDNAAIGIKDALMRLDTGDHIRPLTDHFTLVGHSYGGVISANLAVNFDSLEIPEPKAILLCSPGSGPFKGAVLESYDGLSEDLKMLVLVSKNDRVVGDKFGRKIFKTAPQVKQRNLIRQFPDDHGSPKISAGHNESYSLDKTFDSGLRNISTKRALHQGDQDAVDYFGYWKLLDALLDCERNGENCEIAFGDSEEQRYMGKWSDGTPIKSLEVLLPKE